MARTLEDTNNHNPMCLGCGVDNPASPGFTPTSVGPLELRGTIAFTELHQGAPSRLHGGAIATALDEALGRLAVLHFGEDVATAKLELSFERPALVPAELEVIARIDAHEARKAWMSGELIGEGRIATARALFIRMRPLSDDERQAP